MGLPVSPFAMFQIIVKESKMNIIRTKTIISWLKHMGSYWRWSMAIAVTQISWMYCPSTEESFCTKSNVTQPDRVTPDNLTNSWRQLLGSLDTKVWAIFHYLPTEPEPIFLIRNLGIGSVLWDMADITLTNSADLPRLWSTNNWCALVRCVHMKRYCSKNGAQSRAAVLESMSIVLANAKACSIEPNNLTLLTVALQSAVEEIAIDSSAGQIDPTLLNQEDCWY